MTARSSSNIKYPPFRHVKCLTFYLGHILLAAKQCSQGDLVLLEHRGEYSELVCRLCFPVLGNGSAHWIHLAVHTQSKQFLPEPQHSYSTDYAEYEVGEIAFTHKFNVQQMADECTGITTNDANDKIQAAPLAFTAHNAVGNITDNDASQYWPSREICNML